MVTLQALVGQLFAVLIVVAGKTLARESQEGAVAIDVRFLPQRGVRNERRLMAVAARRPAMRTVQRITGLGMIESRLALFPVN